MLLNIDFEPYYNWPRNICSWRLLQIAIPWNKISNTDSWLFSVFPTVIWNLAARPVTISPQHSCSLCVQHNVNFYFYDSVKNRSFWTNSSTSTDKSSSIPSILCCRSLANFKVQWSFSMFTCFIIQMEIAFDRNFTLSKETKNKYYSMRHECQWTHSLGLKQCFMLSEIEY